MSFEGPSLRNLRTYIRTYLIFAETRLVYILLLIICLLLFTQLSLKVEPSESKTAGTKAEFDMKWPLRVVLGHSLSLCTVAMLAFCLQLTVFVCLHSNFSGGLRKMIFFSKSTYWPFKVIQIKIKSPYATFY